MTWQINDVNIYLLYTLSLTLIYMFKYLQPVKAQGQSQHETKRWGSLFRYVWFSLILYYAPDSFKNTVLFVSPCPDIYEVDNLVV